MAITFDMSRPIQRPSERVALVEAVLAADAADESEWIEWKREVPLGTAQGNFTVARHILGFANRKPEDAARFLGGQAFFLVGVEPGNLVGSSPVDPAKLEDWLRPYLGGDGPVWDAHNVDVGGQHVLAIEVASPRDGDPIRTLRKSYNEWHEGALFIRRKGKTERPSSTEIAMLATRAAAVADRVSVLVRWDAEPTIPALDLGDEALERWVGVKRDALLLPLETTTEREHSAPGTEAAAGALSSIADLARTASFLQQAAGFQPEDRSAEVFRDEVESFVEELHKTAPVVAAARAMANGDTRLLTIVENPTEANFRGLRVRLHVPGPVIAIDVKDEEEWSETRLPAPPRAWGSMKPQAHFDLASSFRPRALFVPPTMPKFRSLVLHIEHDGSVTLTFGAIDLRPRDTVRLNGFHLLARPELAGQIVEATWEATSTSVDGVASGVLPIRVSDEPIAIQRLLDADPTDDNE